MPLLSIDEMRGLSKLVLALSILLVVASCGKKDVPVTTYFFTYKVAINKKIKEPTIINGYYGQMNLYKGDFSAKNDSTGTSAKQPESANYSILLYEMQHKELIDSASFIKDGTLFYNLKKLKKAEIEPKYELIPNKSGFYQFDNNGASYLALIRMNKRMGYYPGGLGMLKGLINTLKEQEIRIDYQATF